MSEPNVIEAAGQFTMNRSPRYSKWRCHLFGSSNGDGISWRPIEGREPNWFWRWMQFLAFGNRWVKDE